jgi:hypothetical protein
VEDARGGLEVDDALVFGRIVRRAKGPAGAGRNIITVDQERGEGEAHGDAFLCGGALAPARESWSFNFPVVGYFPMDSYRGSGTLFCPATFFWIV